MWMLPGPVGRRETEAGPSASLWGHGLGLSGYRGPICCSSPTHRAHPESGHPGGQGQAPALQDNNTAEPISQFQIIFPVQEGTPWTARAARPARLPHIEQRAPRPPQGIPRLSAVSPTPHSFPELLLTSACPPSLSCSRNCGLGVSCPHPTCPSFSPPPPTMAQGHGPIRANWGPRPPLCSPGQSAPGPPCTALGEP